MKIQVLSDLHTEFGDVRLPYVDADVTILAGDIGTGTMGMEYAYDRFPDRPVIYVGGNHEYYRYALPGLNDTLRAAAAGTNIHFLENDERIIDGVRFLGCTLWTDFLLFGPDRRIPSMNEAKEIMADYAYIQFNPESRPLHPRDTEAIHKMSRSWLLLRLAEEFDGPTVVVTHHAPCTRSIPPQYAAQPVSAAYASDLSDLMDAERVSLWIHGHTHWCVDYRVHRTRILSNQFGYPHERAPGFRPGLVVEVG